MGNFKNYTVDGKDYPRVTKILSVLHKPWLENYVKKYARDCLWDMVNNSGPINSVQPEPCSKCLGKENLLYICPYCEGARFHPLIVPHITIEDIKHCLDASNRHGNEAMAQGSLVHSCIEVGIKNWSAGFLSWCDDVSLNSYNLFLREYYPEVQQSFETFVRVMDSEGFRVIESEQTVHYDGEISYAGTLDLIVEMDGELWVGDIKTFESDIYKRTGLPKKPRIKKDHLIQTEAYRRAYNAGICRHGSEWCDDLDVDECELKDNCIEFLDKPIKNRFILYLDRRDKSNYYVHKIDPSTNDEHWKILNACYTIFKGY